MDLQGILYHYLIDAQDEQLLKDQTYRAAEEARDAAERALIEALTRKQRHLLLQFRESDEKLSRMQLDWMLSHCTIHLSAGGTSPAQQ